MTTAQLAATILSDLSTRGWSDWRNIGERLAFKLGGSFSDIAQPGLVAMDKLEGAGLVERRSAFATYRITDAGRAVLAA